jgi:hypothetical protein
MVEEGEGGRGGRRGGELKEMWSDLSMEGN